MIRPAGRRGETRRCPERDRLLPAMAKIDADTRAQVERIAKAKSVPLAPLYASLVAGGVLSGQDAEARERLLGQAADDFIKTRADLKTLASSDPEVARLRAEAEHDLSLGAAKGARAALTRAIEVDQGSSVALEARLKDGKLSEAASHVGRDGVALTHLEHRTKRSKNAQLGQFDHRGASFRVSRFSDRPVLTLDWLGAGPTSRVIGKRPQAHFADPSHQ